MSVALQGATQTRRRRLDLSGLLFAGFALFLVVLIVLPMAWLVVFAFTDAKGAITLGNFVTMVTDPDLVDPLTVPVGIPRSTGAICCLVAARMGWLVAGPARPAR